MDMNSKDNGELTMMLAVAKGFDIARQIAYDNMVKNPFFERWYREAEDAYCRYCGEIGLEPTPVFDEKSHEEKRMAEGHPDYPISRQLKPEVERGEWELHGFVGDYSVWHDGAVYQVTKGKEPTNRAGYRSLEALLQLKGLNIRDLETMADLPSP